MFDKYKKKLLKGKSYEVGVRFVDQVVKDKRLVELHKSLCKKCRRKAKRASLRGKSMDIPEDYYCVVCKPIIRECGLIALDLKKVVE